MLGEFVKLHDEVRSLLFNLGACPAPSLQLLLNILNVADGIPDPLLGLGHDRVLVLVLLRAAPAIPEPHKGVDKGGRSQEFGNFNVDGPRPHAHK